MQTSFRMLLMIKHVLSDFSNYFLPETWEFKHNNRFYLNALFSADFINF